MSAIKYIHKMSVKVRFNEVDMLGVCNNAVYITYFEMARLEYIKAAGLMPKNGIFSDGKIYFIVKNEVNYKSHSHFDDELNVYTRISYIKNSSYGYDHIIEKEATKEIVAYGSGVVVHVDPDSGKSALIDESFITKIQKYQGDVEIRRD